MNTNTRYMQETMDLAKELQERYVNLNAPGTQNIRNPLPMHQLVLTVIPKLPKPGTLIKSQCQIKLTVAGTEFVKTFPQYDFAANVLPSDFWKTKAVTFKQIVNKLRRRGFIVNEGSVRVALAGQTTSVRCDKLRHYFVESK